MGKAAAAYCDINSFDGRVVSPGLAGRSARFILRHTIIALAAVGTVGVSGLGVTLVSAWIARSTMDNNPRVGAQAPSGPGTLTLAGRRDAFAPQWTHTAATVGGMPRMVVDVPASRVKPAARMAQRDLASSPRAAKVAAIPLPPARPSAAPARVAALETVKPVVSPPVAEVARAPIEEPKAVEPKTKVAVALPPPAPAVEKRVVPQQPQDKPKAGAAIDNRTAVYDIAAGTVFMPDGTRLEAHSGLGDKFDDPRYIKVRMRGPTPPNIYNLSMREALFHGVRAIRLNPVDEDRMFGRAGMLAHTYMLGPKGESNGCVSFKDYGKFLQAFLDGKVDRMVVVGDLNGASWRTALHGLPERTKTAEMSARRRYAYNSRSLDPAPTGSISSSRNFSVW
jgi:hypothetical protein